MAKLTKEMWYKEGLKFLGSKGLYNLKIEKLCENINVTKGSFYHHFDSIDSYIKGLMSYWYSMHKDILNEELNEESNLFSKMSFLNKYSAKIKPKTEIAVRALSISNRKFDTLVREVDNLRQQFLKSLYILKGKSEEEAEEQSMLEYASFIGYLSYSVYLNKDDNKTLFASYQKHFKH